MMKTILNILNKFRQSTSGVAATEFALVAPVLLILVLGLIDVSTAVTGSLDLKTSARAGAEYALANSDDAIGIRAAVIGATGNTSATLTVTTTVFCECARVALTCGQTCPLDSSVPDQFVKVAVSDAYSPLFLPLTISQLEADVTLSIQ
jgi:Flp pilus assembly protein TadG